MVMSIGYETCILIEKANSLCGHLNRFHRLLSNYIETMIMNRFYLNKKSVTLDAPLVFTFFCLKHMVIDII